MESSILKVHSKVRGSVCGQFHLKKQKFSPKKIMKAGRWKAKGWKMLQLLIGLLLATAIGIMCPVGRRSYSMFQASDYFSL